MAELKSGWRPVLVDVRARRNDDGPDGGHLAIAPTAVPRTAWTSIGFRLGVARAFDVVVAATVLLILAPAMLLVAVVIRRSDGGPAFFRQERVGRHGETFTLVKFRTMRDGTHASVLACGEQRAAYLRNGFKLDEFDPRITPLGRILRKTSIDELPQLWNVLRGQMGLVGVRPLLADELALRPVGDQALYRLLRPGLTGLWQVEGRSSLTHEERLELDRRYVQRWRLANDLAILARTPAAVLRFDHSR